MAVSLKFGGHDFADYCTCEVLHSACVPCEAEAVVVPGADGKRLVQSQAGVREVRVRLRQVHSCGNCDVDASTIEATVFSWLSVGAADLELPGIAGFYRDAVCVECGPWSRGRDGVCCEVTFRCYDPVRYGDEITKSTATFTVGGNRPAWPVVEVEVSLAREGVVFGIQGGDKISMLGDFSKGDVVRVDCLAGTVLLNGEPAEDLVDPASDFFQIGPGSVELYCAYCSVKSVKYRERWM